MTPLDAFDGVIGNTIAESQLSWPVRPHPGTDAPNVVVILLDDTGFATSAATARRLAVSLM
jgi:hypothetical protein